MKGLLSIAAFCAFIFVQAQEIRNNPQAAHGNKFEQLGTILPTPNNFRNASGAPGPDYWQQQADYHIICELDEDSSRLTGAETITYHNNSPDTLHFLWMQLDENQHNTLRNAHYEENYAISPEQNIAFLHKLEEAHTDNGYGVNITSIANQEGNALQYTINKTMMRVELPLPLAPKQKFIFSVKWNYKLTNRMLSGGRGGYEIFPEDGNRLFTMSQWYPRMCAYTDYTGWQNMQMTNKEFALSFGNFDVQITVPADLVVGATGQCVNYQQTMTPQQFTRWQNAQNASEPVDIVTLQEAKAAEKKRTRGKKTWKFSAQQVRDFAWTCSRKFVWDAMPVTINGKKIMCMSYYGKEAYPLYHLFSTYVIAYTLRSYSAHTIPYPYPVAQAVEAANGMEYPMICFTFGRADKSGSFTEANKNGMTGVVIHEVGHNFMPMIINNDERLWSWMDEGINSFLEYLTEKSVDSLFPSRRGYAAQITGYMSLPRSQQEPIMTTPENMLNFSATTYSKTATAMNILRDLVMGDSLFDYAFREYAKRWAFRQPTPADFFRTMEDASAEDLDWFWRGWFYSTEPCDIAIDTIKYYRASPDATPASEKPVDKKERERIAGKHIYEIRISNKGGLITPVIIGWTYADGTMDLDTIRAQIWRHNEDEIAQVFMKAKQVVSVQLDPLQETGDINQKNNRWDRLGKPSKFTLYQK